MILLICSIFFSLGERGPTEGSLQLRFLRDADLLDRLLQFLLLGFHQDKGWQLLFNCYNQPQISISRFPSTWQEEHNKITQIFKDDFFGLLKTQQIWRYYCIEKTFSMIVLFLYNILIFVMPRLSTYSNYDYPQGQEQTMPWEFWTDEERSLVIKEGYKDLVLSSAEVKPYLNASRIHFYAQWLVPIVAAGVCYGPLRVSLLASAYRKHPQLGFRSSSLLFGGFTLMWLNMSPFYVSKENAQVQALKTMWNKVGSSMKVYNDLLATSTTSTSIDKETWSLYAERNAKSAAYAEEDQAPPFLPNTPATTKIKRMFL